MPEAGILEQGFHVHFIVIYFAEESENATSSL